MDKTQQDQTVEWCEHVLPPSADNSSLETIDSSKEFPEQEPKIISSFQADKKKKELEMQNMDLLEQDLKADTDKSNELTGLTEQDIDIIPAMESAEDKSSANIGVKTEIKVERNVVPDSEDENTSVGQALMNVISDLEAVPDNLELRSGDSLEQEVMDRLDRLGQLTHKQAAFLQSISNTFTKRLTKLIDYYKDEKIKAIDTLAGEQQKHMSMTEQLDTAIAKVEKLELLLKNSEDNKRDLTEKLNISHRQIEKLEGILSTEQELRKQADKRAKEALNTAARSENLRKQEIQKKAQAQAAAKKAITRAREVMSYFFNSALDDTYNMGAKAKIMGGIPNFDDLMLSKKDYF